MGLAFLSFLVLFLLVFLEAQLGWDVPLALIILASFAYFILFFRMMFMMMDRVFDQILHWTRKRR